MAATRTPAKFYSPLAIGAPEPYRALPVRLERMIHFVPPHNEKIRAKIKDIAARGRRRPRQPRGCHPRRPEGGGARKASSPWRATPTSGRPACGRASTASTVPWMLDDVTEIVAAVGDKLDVIMLPKVEGPVGHPLSRPAARPARSQAQRQEAHPHPCDPGDGRGRQQRRGDRSGLPAHARHEPRAGGSRRLARHEDDAGRRRPSRLRRAGGSPPATAPPSGRSSSRICGTTRSAKWSMRASPTA